MRILRWLGSVRLAIALLVMLTIAGVLGGVIPQIGVTANAEDIHRSYGPLWHFVVRLFSLGRVFHSWWFITLLSLFSFNLLTCTLRRMISSLRIIWRPLGPLSNPDNSSVPCVDWSVTDAQPGDVVDLAREALRHRRFRVRQAGDQLTAVRWRWCRIAPDVVHLGVLLILLGAVLGTYRFEGTLSIGERQIGEVILPCSGQETELCLEGVPFGVRVDAFGAETCPDWGAFSGFWTMMSVIENAEATATHKIELNRPLRYRGMSFYQSFYGHDLRGAEATILVVDWDRRIGAGSFKVSVGGSFAIPETEHVVSFERFYTTLAVDDTGRLYNANTPSPQNPVAKLAIYAVRNRVFSLQSSELVYANHPEPHASEGSPYRFYIEEYHVPRYVGLTYSRDPGYPVVWWGFVLVMIGLLGLVYFRPKRVWIVFNTEQQRLFVVGGGKSRSVDSDWLESIASTIARSLKKGE